jgi:hypothetical protein
VAVKEITRVTERDADGLVVTTERYTEGTPDLAPEALAKNAADAAIMAEFGDAVRAERAAVAREAADREKELQEEAEWIAEARKRSGHPEPDRATELAALTEHILKHGHAPALELAEIQIDEVSVVNRAANGIDGWVTPPRVTTPEHPAELIALVKSVARLDPTLNPNIVAGLATAIHGMYPTEDHMAKAIAKLEPFTAGGSPVGNLAHPTPADGFVPKATNAPNAVSGTTAAQVAAIMARSERAKASREANRHPARGTFQSPSRSAGEIMKTATGLFRFTTGQSGNGPR